MHASVQAAVAPIVISILSNVQDFKHAANSLCTVALQQGHVGGLCACSHCARHMPQ